MKINKETKELALTNMCSAALCIVLKIDKKHKLEDYYYLLGATVLTNVLDKIEKSHIELMNKIINVEKRFINIEKSMKEVSKQQKYLWQTLEDLHLQEVKK